MRRPFQKCVRPQHSSGHHWIPNEALLWSNHACNLCNGGRTRIGRSTMILRLQRGCDSSRHVIPSKCIAPPIHKAEKSVSRRQHACAAPSNRQGDLPNKVCHARNFWGFPASIAEREVDASSSVNCARSRVRPALIDDIVASILAFEP